MTSPLLGPLRPVRPPLATPVGLPAAGRTFLKQLTDFRIIDPYTAKAFLVHNIDHLSEYTDGLRFGQALVVAGLLTEYQLNRVLAGTAHGLVLGNYRVLDRLGGGAVGVVFRGEHTLLRRRAAIKVVPVDDDFPAPLLERFHAEMRVLAELRHPHVVTAYDAGTLPPPQDGLPTLHYLVMELVGGGDLERYVYDRGPVPVPQACEWARQAAAGLQAAHDRHLVHRDLKPSNLLLTEDGQVKLVDFGLARQFCSNLTDPRALLGSLEFMAPEQSIDPTRVCGAADVYGLGATLFWLLSGQTPHPQEQGLTEFLHALQTAEPRRLRQVLPDAPPELDELLHRMLARDPVRRPATPQAVMSDLIRYSAPGTPPALIAEPGPAATGPAPDEPRRDVLVVDDEPRIRDLVRRTLEPLGCFVREADDLPAARAAVERQPSDLIVLDLALPGGSGYDFCRSLHELSRAEHLKILVVSGQGERDELTIALAEGADDFLAKPFEPWHLAARARHLLDLKAAQERTDQFARHLLTVNRQLEQSLHARSTDLRRSHDALLFAMAKMAEARDGETAGHLRRLQRYTAALANRLRSDRDWATIIDPKFLDNLQRCVPLHDIGKIVLPDSILLKPGPLDSQERAMMQTHTSAGSAILDALGQEFGGALDFMATARAVVRHHHERFDGRGYPDKLAGDEIPPAARLVAVADVYDALRRQRPYKSPLTHRQAVRWMLEESGGQFTPTVLRAFALCQEEFARIYTSLGQ